MQSESTNSSLPVHPIEDVAYMEKSTLNAFIVMQIDGNITEKMSFTMNSCVSKLETCKYESYSLMKLTCSSPTKVRVLLNMCLKMMKCATGIQLVKLDKEDHYIIIGSKEKNIKQHYLYKVMVDASKQPDESNYVCHPFLSKIGRQLVEDQVNESTSEREREIQQECESEWAERKKYLESQLDLFLEKQTQFEETCAQREAQLSLREKQCDEREIQLQLQQQKCNDLEQELSTRKRKCNDQDVDIDMVTKKILKKNIFSDSISSAEYAANKFHSCIHDHLFTVPGTLAIVKKIKKNCDFFKDADQFLTSDILQDTEENAKKVLKRMALYYHPDKQEAETNNAWKHFASFAIKYVNDFRTKPYKKSAKSEWFPL